jgi:hypothetical protein
LSAVYEVAGRDGRPSCWMILGAYCFGERPRDGV